MNKEIKELKRMSDLRNILSFLNVDNLSIFLKSLDIEDKPCRRIIKENRICDKLTSEKYITDKISTLVDKELELIIKIVKNDGVLSGTFEFEENHLDVLNYYGIVYSIGNENSNKNYCIIPKEILVILESINLLGFKEIVNINTDFNRVVEGLVITYGIIEEDYAIEYYNKNNIFKNKVDKSINKSIVNERNSVISNYTLNKCQYYTSKCLFDENNKSLIDGIIEKLKTENRKEYSLDFILDHKTKSYLDDVVIVNELIGYIVENDEGMQTAEEIVYNLYDLLKVYNLDYIYEYCYSNTTYKKLNLLIKNKVFISYLTELEKIVPKWRSLGNLK